VTTNSVAPVGRLSTAIALRGVSKRYRLYAKPMYRLLDLFGACPATPKYYSEHLAVRDVGLEIGRGEKVAIIGRNGAGKSTLLKLITGLVQPTSGSIEVNGQVSNLLQIGSGFHPDFTGRQNVYASLAHQGIVGRQAARLFDEILAFAEIEEYIDQPMKTYSTGMCSRLMFSSSIVIRPEILIVDEILGVGDAYFAHKSFDRMRKVCSQDGTTLLLVTHDIYSAQNLCDRFIWLDRGEVKFDGDGKSAVSLYESSIKEQEEHALRQQNAARLASAGDGGIVHLLFRSQTGFAPQAPFALELIEVGFSDGHKATLPVASGAPGWQLQPEGNLGPSQVVDGRACRVLRTSGSIYHKAEWVVAVPQGARVESVRVRWHYEADEPVDLRVFTTERRLLVAGSLGGSPRWREEVFGRAEAERQELDPIKQSNYGSGLARISRVQFLDADGRDVVDVLHGQPLTVRVHVALEPALIDRRATFILAFVRHGSPYSACVYSPDLSLGPGDHAIVTAKIDSVQLGSGLWYVNIAIGEPALLERGSSTYFALDPAWYHLLASRIEFRVGSVSHLDASGVFVVQQAEIRVDEIPLKSEPVLSSTPQ
jgi:ABC-type polysaccharide/polyol phosphate transport system ATPase subunit